MLGLNSRPCTRGEEAFESLMPESLDRHVHSCNLYGYRLRPALFRALVATGAAAPGSPLSPANLRVTALINNIQAAVPFAGLSPGFVGLYQVNIQIPDLPAGTYPVTITAGSAVSNTPTISVTR